MNFFLRLVLLVGLIALGGILFALLLVCIILTCWKHNRPTRRRTVVPGIDILPHKTLTVHGSGSKTGTLQDKRAMIEDTSSEASEDSCQLPYVAKKVRTARDYSFAIEIINGCFSINNRTQQQRKMVNEL